MTPADIAIPLIALFAPILGAVSCVSAAFGPMQAGAGIEIIGPSGGTLRQGGGRADFCDPRGNGLPLRTGFPFDI